MARVRPEPSNHFLKDVIATPPEPVCGNVFFVIHPTLTSVQSLCELLHRQKIEVLNGLCPFGCPRLWRRLFSVQHLQQHEALDQKKKPAPIERFPSLSERAITRVIVVRRSAVKPLN
jgi:hypothetical protein